jgi:hypothetical protein
MLARFAAPAFLFALLTMAPGCGQGQGEVCQINTDCAGGLVCICGSGNGARGLCYPADYTGCNTTATDSGPPTDANVDMGTDANVDANVDAGTDANVDANVDAFVGTDANVDANVDAAVGNDANTDAGSATDAATAADTNTDTN